jgi:hypothetical protein
MFYSSDRSEIRVGNGKGFKGKERHEHAKVMMGGRNKTFYSDETLWFSVISRNICDNIIIFINCNWVDTRWQYYFTCIQNMTLVTTKFESGGLHEKHVVATWKVGNHLSICL